MRHYSVIDQICMKIDKTVRICAGQNIISESAREYPAKNMIDADLSSTQAKHIAGLMRVNYAGEVCAQALYLGQALTAKNRLIRQKLEKASFEETDHLYWCQSRIQELNSHVSYLNPLWYTGSFLLGTIAGLCGDRWSLGFLAETERQVVGHLETHLEKIPAEDHKTRAILSQMRDEEAHHATLAVTEGAATLPRSIQVAMQITAKLMTSTTYWM